MRFFRLTLIAITLSFVAFFSYTSLNKPAELKPELVTAAKYGIGNQPVLMTGCKAFEHETPKVVIYEPVVKNFRTLPCATEVPPPFQAIENGKRVSLK